MRLLMSIKSRAARALMLFAALGAYPAAAQAQSMDEFFDDSGVHEIRLTIHSKDWALLKEKFQENLYYACKFEWRDTTVHNVAIRPRGSGSRSGTKPGLRVDFDRFAPDQTFAGLKSFVLDNLVQDASMIRERVANAFFRRLGIPAPREAHVRLFVNGQNVGLYAIVEPIDKGFLGRSFGQDSEGGTENDGYLFEYDYTKEYRFEYMGSNLDEYKIFDPKTNENKAAAQIWGPIEEMIKKTNEAPDATFVSDVSPFLDLGLFAKYIGIEAFLAEDDGFLGYAGMNNFYLYRFENTTRFQFLPWDKDNTFIALDFWVMRGVSDNVLARRTLNIQEYRNRFLDTLLDAAASADEPDAGMPEFDENGDPLVRPGWLEREITRQYTQIRTLARNDSLKPFSNDDFEAAYQTLLTFARGRSTEVRTDVGELRPSSSSLSTTRR